MQTLILLRYVGCDLLLFMYVYVDHQIALSVLARLSVDSQVQAQLGERMIVSVMPVVCAVFALNQPRLHVPLLEILCNCCQSGAYPPSLVF